MEPDKPFRRQKTETYNLPSSYNLDLTDESPEAYWQLLDGDRSALAELMEKQKRFIQVINDEAMKLDLDGCITKQEARVKSLAEERQSFRHTLIALDTSLQRLKLDHDSQDALVKQISARLPVGYEENQEHSPKHEEVETHKNLLLMHQKIRDSTASSIESTRKNRDKYKELTDSCNMALQSARIRLTCYVDNSRTISSLAELVTSEVSVVERLLQPSTKSHKVTGITSLEKNILESIFLQCINITVEEYSNSIKYSTSPFITHPARSSVLSISTVCRLWKRICAENSNLWCYLSYPVNHTNFSFQEHPSNAMVMAEKTGYTVTLDVRFPVTSAIITRLKEAFSAQIIKLGIICHNTQFRRFKYLLSTLLESSGATSLEIIGGLDRESKEVLAFKPGTCLRLEHLMLLDNPFGILGIHPDSGTPFENLKTLIIVSKTLESRHDIYNLFVCVPRLEFLELDLGMEDIPMFTGSTQVVDSKTIQHLRFLKTRFSYLENRLSFLKQLDLPDLSGLHFTTCVVVSYGTPMIHWIEFFTSNSIGKRIISLDLGSKAKLAPLSPALPKAILSGLPCLEQLSIQGDIADSFIKGWYDDSLGQDILAPNLKVVSLADSNITAETLISWSENKGKETKQRPYVKAYRCPELTKTVLEKVVVDNRTKQSDAA